MSLNNSSEFDDVMNDGYVSGSVNVTTTEVEAKVGASRLANREAITITNRGNTTIYYGPTGVTSTTGDALYKDQTVALPLGGLGIFLITASGSSTAIVQEFS
jgi:hypothetical protein